MLAIIYKRLQREDAQAEIQMWTVLELGDVQICDWGFCHGWQEFPRPATSMSCRAERGGPGPDPSHVLISPSPVGPHQLDGPWDFLLGGATMGYKEPTPNSAALLISGSGLVKIRNIQGTDTQSTAKCFGSSTKGWSPNQFGDSWAEYSEPKGFYGDAMQK